MPYNKNIESHKELYVMKESMIFDITYGCKNNVRHRNKNSKVDSLFICKNKIKDLKIICKYSSIEKAMFLSFSL
jgi:hypothetical protein